MMCCSEILAKTTQALAAAYLFEREFSGCNYSSYFLTLLLLFDGIPWVSFSGQWRCRDCSHLVI
jgi:hypothetical protein